jgi:hypothetical protein
MRKLISSGFMMCAGVLSIPAPVNDQFPISIPVADYSFDPRLDDLTAFFAASAAPAAEVAHIFIQVADAYGLDWRLLPSISWVESEGGRTARNNNLFGWDGGRAQFTSPAAAIRAVAYCLATSRLYRDKSLDEILAIYNPSQEYARKVKWVMQRMAPSDDPVTRPSS